MSAVANDDVSSNQVDDVASVVDSSYSISEMIDAVAIDDAAYEIETATGAEISIDDASLTNFFGVTPIDIEKAKVRALSRQLTRSQDENRQLQSMLKKAQIDLERQIQQTLQLQKRHTKNRGEDAIEQPVSSPCNEVQKLKADLASTNKDLAEELETTKKREAKMLRLQEQLDSLKQQREQQEIGDEKQSDIFIKNLKKQRSELLIVMKKQTKLIEILKQQRAHVEAAALLNILEKDLMKVVNSR
jgi:hypothetical protein